ncbi:ATP-dependent zinc metalloprotease FtsH [Bienertia sinuspersici]
MLMVMTWRKLKQIKKCQMVIFPQKRIQENEKGRGRYKCKNIAKLKKGEKLEVTFYNNRVVGPNHEVFARHFGIIVLDTNVVPVRVYKWKYIGDREKDHMWTAVTDVFYNENMESYREHVLNHMKELWINSRSDLLRYNVTNKKISLKVAFNHKPLNGLDGKEWKWLIKEVYSSEDFKKVSARNSANIVLYPKELAYRTRIRASLLSKMKFEKLRKKIHHIMILRGGRVCDGLVGRLVGRAGRGRDGLVGRIGGQAGRGWVFWWAWAGRGSEIAQEVFNSKLRNRVVRFGGGMKVADLRGKRPSREELEAELNSTKKQNQILKDRMGEIQDKNNQLKGRMVQLNLR